MREVGYGTRHDCYRTLLGVDDDEVTRGWRWQWLFKVAGTAPAVLDFGWAILAVPVSLRL